MIIILPFLRTMLSKKKTYIPFSEFETKYLLKDDIMLMLKLIVFSYIPIYKKRLISKTTLFKRKPKISQFRIGQKPSGLIFKRFPLEKENVFSLRD